MMRDLSTKIQFKIFEAVFCGYIASPVKQAALFYYMFGYYFLLQS